MKSRLPRTCHGCKRRMEEVGCKRVVVVESTGNAIWVCPTCEPILLEVYAEEGWDVPPASGADGVWRRLLDPITRAVQAASRAKRGQP